jgi:hypothetical protein
MTDNYLIPCISFASAAVVVFNEERPELCDPFELILQAKDIPGTDNKTFYYGFLIFLEYDLRSLVGSSQDIVKGRIWSSNEVLITTTALSKPFESDRDTIRIRDFAKTALDNFHHDYHRRNMKEKHFLIRFGDEVKLEAKSIHAHLDTEDETTLQPETCPDFYLLPDGTVNRRDFVMFKVARLDIEKYKKARYEQQQGGHMHNQTGVGSSGFTSPGFASPGFAPQQYGVHHGGIPYATPPPHPTSSMPHAASGGPIPQATGSMPFPQATGSMPFTGYTKPSVSANFYYR